MKPIERPILMASSMVLATLDDRKTQTRRVVTQRNSIIDGHTGIPYGRKWEDFDFSKAYVDEGPSPAGNPGPYLRVPLPCEETMHRIYPKYQKRWRLYVRETWATDVAEMPPIDVHGHPTCKEVTMYRADGDEGIYKWKPSIHMPKESARIWLEITDVRVEQIQEISGEDARDEGVSVPPQSSYVQYICAFKKLWNSINEKRGYSWESNCLVWVLTFKVI